MDDKIIRRNIEDAITFAPKPKSVDLDRDPILTEREQTHGPFAQQSAIWDQIMMALDWGKFKSPGHRLVITMLCVKLSRACCHPEVRDHWDDIAGYAKLAAEACE